MYLRKSKKKPAGSPAGKQEARNSLKSRGYEFFKNAVLLPEGQVGVFYGVARLTERPEEP